MSVASAFETVSTIRDGETKGSGHVTEPVAPKRRGSSVFMAPLYAVERREATSPRFERRGDREADRIGSSRSERQDLTSRRLKKTALSLGLGL